MPATISYGAAEINLRLVGADTLLDVLGSSVWEWIRSECPFGTSMKASVRMSCRRTRGREANEGKTTTQRDRKNAPRPRPPPVLSFNNPAGTRPAGGTIKRGQVQRKATISYGAAEINLRPAHAGLLTTDILGSGVWERTRTLSLTDPVF